MNDSLSIWSAYREDRYNNRLREYYLDLRNAAQREIAENGSCKLLDQINSQIYMQDNITIIALRDAIEFCLGGGLSQNNVRFYCSKKGRYYLWENLNHEVRIDKFRADRAWAMYSEIKEKLCDLKQSSLNEKDASLNENQIVPDDAPCNNDKPEEIKVNEPDVSSSPSFEQAANMQAQKIIDDATEKAKRIVEEAMQQAQSMIIEAEHKGSEVIENAKRDAEKITQEAFDEKQRILEAEAEDKAKHLVNQKLLDYVDKRCSANQEQVSNTQILQNEIANENYKIKETVGNGIGEVKNAISQTITSAIEVFENSMLGKVYEWQSMIYKGDFGQLVTCYINLQKLIKFMDKSILENAEKEDEVSLAVRESISNYREKYNNLANQFMRAMNRMGIVSYTPNEDEEFNSFYHMHDNDGTEYIDDEVYNGKPINRCVDPGFMMTRNEMEFVIFRAVVDTKQMQ